MSRRRGPLVPARDISHLVSDYSRRNQVVRVLPADLEGPVEPGVYRVLADVVNTKTGARWTELWGGPTGTRQFRGVRPHLVRPATKAETLRAGPPVKEIIT